MARILIVDDDAAVRMAMRVVLEQEQFDVAEARDGNEALELVRAQPPALILCDIFMPGKDGFDTIRLLRQEFPKVPVVAVSGGGSGGGMDVLRLAQRLGAIEVLHKPLHPGGLVGVVRRLAGAKLTMKSQIN
jgi:CheY-like chemotaxis protein